MSTFCCQCLALRSIKAPCSMASSSWRLALLLLLTIFSAANTAGTFEAVDRHGDTVWDFRDPATGGTLRINYYWVDGIYQNGEHGCTKRGMYTGNTDTFPVYSPTSDLIIANGAAWCFQAAVKADAERAGADLLPAQRRMLREVVCWNGPAIELGGTPVGSVRENYAGPWGGPEHRVSVTGDGCARCQAGATCTFFLHFASGAYFDTHISIMREVMVTLTGPSVVYARAVPHHTLDKGDSSYLVSYRAWDAGTYTLAVSSDCSRVSNDPTLSSHVLVSLQVAVSDAAAEAANPAPSGSDEGGEGKGEGGGVAGDSGGEGPVVGEQEEAGGPAAIERLPCEFGEYARWVLGAHELANGQAGGGGGSPWLFKPYRCAADNFVRPEEFVTRLAERGVREISFIGDSHMRSVSRHLQFLLSGTFEADRHGNTMWDFRDPATGGTLRVNYYWVDGIYQNGKHGCTNRGMYTGNIDTFPVYSPTSDVIIVNGAAWSFEFCSEPERAYVSHLPKFLEWQLAQPHKPSARFLWRSEAPYPVPLTGCNARRNSALAWANEFARSLSARYCFRYMDFWAIEAPRYIDTCYFEHDGNWYRDSHYSCLYANNTKVYGDVGEAAVRHFMHALVTLHLS
eukprot:jgi/Mesen1/8882/ME000532S08276